MASASDTGPTMAAPAAVREAAERAVREVAEKTGAEYLTPEDLAELFEVPVSTIYGWRQKHYGPRAAEIGKHLRYRRAEVDRWVTQQMAASA